MVAAAERIAGSTPTPSPATEAVPVVAPTGDVAGGAEDAELVRRRWPEVLGTLERRRVTWAMVSQTATVASIEDGVLLPQELSGEEGISAGFTYTLTCLSPDAYLELKQFIGLPVQISLLTDGGEERALCGLVTRAECAGSDGGFTRYVLTLQDPLAVLGLRVNSRVFQDLSVRQFVAVLLSEHRQDNPILASCFDLDDRCIG